MGRVSHFVPFMSIAIALLGVTSSAFVQLQPYMWSDFLHIGLPFIYLIPFILVIIGLSHRFSNAASQQRFPVNALLIAVIGLVVGQFVAWHFILQLEDLFDNGFEGFVQFSYWAIPLSSALVWASVMILGAASLFHEGEVEEDTREAEALGWLINHAYDDQTLHEALLCLPAIANTPLRRAALLRSSRDILTLLINTLVNEPAQRCLLERSGGGRGIELDYSFDEHREARLMFYLACLAEVSTESMGDESQLGHWRMRWDQLMGRLHGSWLYQNWYRALTISPQRIMQRELRFPRSWYSWFQSFQPDTLLLDLHTLSSHSDSYISTTAKAISSLLYPSTSPLENYSVWPIHCGNCVGNAEFFTYHRVLIEVRLVTMRFIQESRQKNDSKVSRRRHLFCYYDDLMNTWISGLASDGVMDIAQNGKFFEAAMTPESPHQ
ncbi:hypothetical protein FRC02_004384 [Tulasnella sp. 418]|nr:hypothetical protein FRC02_004384 [Tulasnella sp. 418]